MPTSNHKIHLSDKFWYLKGLTRQQSLKTVLNDYAALFRKRFSEGLSIRKAADAMQQNRGVIERRQAALYRAFAQLLQQRDEADGVYRLMQKTEYDQRDIEDLLE